MWVLLLALIFGVMSGSPIPEVLWAPRPLCPDSAEFSDIEGVVHVMVVVDSTGHIMKADIDKSTLPLVLEARALDAAARWVFAPFTPVRSGGRTFPTRLVIPFVLRKYCEGPNDLANIDLDLTVLGRPTSVGDTVETRTTVQVKSSVGMRIVLDFPGRIVLTSAERLYEVLGHQGGELALTESGLQWIGTVEPTQPLVLRRQFILASCDGDSVVVTQEPGRFSYFVRAAQRAAVILSCR